MIIFISDLHLTDGTFDYHEPGNPGNDISHDFHEDAFRIFWDDIYSLIAKRRNKGADIRGITIVLLGDILEMRTTIQWVESDYPGDGRPRRIGARPWNENRDKPSRVCERILDKILEHNREKLKYLTLNRLDEIHPKNGFRQLVDSGIKVEFIYVAGNHDSLIISHRDSKLRDKLTGELGWIIPAPAGPSEPPGTRYVNTALGIAAEHGHRGDFIDFYGDSYVEPPIGTLLADTVGRLMHHIQRQGSRRPERTRELVRVVTDIDIVRPSSDGFQWLLENIPGDGEILAALRSVFRQALEELAEDADPLLDFLFPRIRPRISNAVWYIRWPFKLVSLLFKEKKLAQSLLVKFIQKTVSRLNKDEAADPLRKVLSDLRDKINRLMPRGKKERAENFYHEQARIEIKEPFAKYIVYGHSHQFEIAPLETRDKKRTFYFNSGTWKKTIQRNLFGPETTERGDHSEKADFQKWARMTYVCFYDAAKKENKDHVFELWHGDLKYLDD